MGKHINLGRRLKYPITITKLLKQPGETFQKQDIIFQYTFTWLREVGDPFRESWQEKQTTIADWESPADGKILRWEVHEGMTIDKDIACMEIEESCSHPVQFAGLCAVCGKDMKETSWATDKTDAERAPINMFHDQTLVSVSQDEASRAEEQLQRRLLKNRKLSLVVDLDQTIIHACIEPTVGEWQRDPNSPNYEAVKDVKAFQLSDDGPKGLASGCWYYIKMRPGLTQFLANIAELYELHVYTMGTRAYAQNIAQIVDPEHKLFGDRIISRDENGSLSAKTLSRLFPVDTKMVVIIDDRADVWPKNRQNLIKVVPYDFFVGIGDINSSFLPKRQDVPKASTSIKLRLPEKVPDKPEVVGVPGQQSAEDNGTQSSGTEEKEVNGDDQTRISALEELASMVGGDDPTVRRIQAQEQEEFLEKQIKERPLLHMQQELEKEDEESSTTSTNGDSEEAVKNGDDENEHPHHRHPLLKDDDKELSYLEEHLKRLHSSFYDEYDRSLAVAVGGRVAHLRPGMKKKFSLKDDTTDVKTVPDIGEVMPRMKAETLAGTVIVLSGLVPLEVNALRSEIVQKSLMFGAQVETRISSNVTHVVVSPNRILTQKVQQAAKYPHIKIVTQQWLIESMNKWRKEDESPYLIEIQRDDKPTVSDQQSFNSSDDESMEENGTEDEDNENRVNDDDQDADGLIPDDLDNPTSPIDDLQKFEWGSADAELEEFMASGSEDGDSDTGSVASHDSDRSQRSNINNKKHPRQETDDEDSDEESSLAKKQRLSRVRTTGLKTVKTPHSATSNSSLPTPEITGEEELDDADYPPPADEDEEGLDDGDLEAEMLAEFEKGYFEEQRDDDAGGSLSDDGGG